MEVSRKNFNICFCNSFGNVIFLFSSFTFKTPTPIYSFYKLYENEVCPITKILHCRKTAYLCGFLHVVFFISPTTAGEIIADTILNIISENKTMQKGGERQ